MRAAGNMIVLSYGKLSDRNVLFMDEYTDHYVHEHLRSRLVLFMDEYTDRCVQEQKSSRFVLFIDV
jgi:hypothetical protein